MEGEREHPWVWYFEDSEERVDRGVAWDWRGTRVLVWRRVKGSSSGIQGKASVFKSKRGNQVRGVPMIVWCCILFVIDWIVMYEGMGIVIFVKIRMKIEFLGFFQKPPGGSCVTTRRRTHQTQFLGINDEPPGGTNPVSLFLVIFWCFGIPVVWLWCLYVLVWILMLIDSAYVDFAARYYFWYEIGRLGFMWRVGNNCAWYKFVIWHDVTKMRLFYDL